MTTLLPCWWDSQSASILWKGLTADIKKDGRCNSTSSHSTTLKLKCLGYKHCHLALVKSFVASVCSVGISIRYPPIHPADSFMSSGQLSIMQWSRLLEHQITNSKQIDPKNYHTSARMTDTIFGKVYLTCTLIFCFQFMIYDMIYVHCGLQNRSLIFIWILL